MQISSFKDWLVESAALDPVRLLDLGLWAGPGIQWRLADRVDPAWPAVGNPEIGLLQIIYDLPHGQADPAFSDQLDNSETWALYPTSFGPARNTILAAWQRYHHRRAELAEFTDLIQHHLHLAVRKYAHFKLTGSVPARHWRTMALLPPGEAPSWSEWYTLNTQTSLADLRPGEVPARRR